MALMSEERRREMEEEMSRFEQEIALPGSPDSPPMAISIIPSDSVPLQKLKPEIKPKIPPPPPPPPTVVNILPSVLCPPPPPPSSPPKVQLLPPPPPPFPPSLQPPVAPGSIRFIPSQLHRQPPRMLQRPPFMGMRAPGAFPPQGMPPFPHMHHPPPPPHMQHQHLSLHGMGVALPMPPGFCAPGPQMQSMPPMNRSSQPYLPPVMPSVYNSPANTPSEGDKSQTVKESEPDPVVASAPAVYAAPPMKSQTEKLFEGQNTANGESTNATTEPYSQKADKGPVAKLSDESNAGVAVATAPSSEETTVSKKKEKKKKIVRMAGGQAWEDNSLLDWDSDDFRIFCGDLGNDVTDEVLIRAFSKYQSFVRAKVIRDKRTNKTKGYGFVSFKDPQDFIKAMREMNGRYVGSRPIKLRKSTWKDRNIELVRKKQKEKEKLGLL